jgi:hypothetical protein
VTFASIFFSPVLRPPVGKEAKRIRVSSDEIVNQVRTTDWPPLSMTWCCIQAHPGILRRDRRPGVVRDTTPPTPTVTTGRTHRLVVVMTMADVSLVGGQVLQLECLLTSRQFYIT